MAYQDPQVYAKYLKINLIVEAESNSIKAYFDRDNFEKIIYNLLSNALKFTVEGEILINVELAEINDYICLKFMIKAPILGAFFYIFKEKIFKSCILHADPNHLLIEIL